MTTPDAPNVTIGDLEDPLMADHGQPVCDATHNGWCCTRAKGHPLPHVAWGGRVCDVWWITVHDRTETRRSDG